MNELVKQAKTKQYNSIIDKVEITSDPSTELLDKTKEIIGIALFTTDEFDNAPNNTLAASVLYTAHLSTNKETTQENVALAYDTSVSGIRKWYHKLVEVYSRTDTGPRYIDCPDCGRRLIKKLSHEASVDLQPPNIIKCRNFYCPDCGEHKSATIVIEPD